MSCCQHWFCEQLLVSDSNLLILMLQAKVHPFTATYSFTVASIKVRTVDRSVTRSSSNNSNAVLYTEGESFFISEPTTSTEKLQVALETSSVRLPATTRVHKWLWQKMLMNDTRYSKKYCRILQGSVLKCVARSNWTWSVAMKWAWARVLSRKEMFAGESKFNYYQRRYQVTGWGERLSLIVINFTEM